LKKVIIFLLIVLMMNLAIGSRVKTTDYFMAAGSIIDTAAAGSEIIPDSVRITTYHNALAPVFDGWFNTADDQCSSGYGNDIVFLDAYNDIGGSNGDGTYYTRVQYYNVTYGLYHKFDYYWEIGNYGDTLQRNASTLTASDNIGINADDVTGDFEYTNFNGASAWWNEGKTGYSLSGTQSFNLTGNITGNLSGSVGSVSGAVGSISGVTFPGNFADLSISASTGLVTFSNTSIATATSVTNAVTITSNSDITNIKAKTDKLIFDAHDSLIVERTENIIKPVWQADTATYNSVSESYGQVLSTPTYVQGSGADATPSEWDATDINNIRQYVWQDDTGSYNVTAES
jgi:hypothetical protein